MYHRHSIRIFTLMYDSKTSSACVYRNSFVVTWTKRHDIELCKEMLAEKIFETRKRSLERGKAWDNVAKRLEEIDYLSFRVDQRAVRDR